MKLCRNLTGDWEKAGIRLPSYDTVAMANATVREPIWVHFGAGNIFRGYIAALQDRLLEQGLCDRGIIAAESYDGEIIEKIYRPFDSMSLTVTLCADGTLRKELVSSIAEGLCVDGTNDADLARLKEIFCCDSLQMVSFTVTEKGYALHDGTGAWLAPALADLENGPENCKNVMFLVTALLCARYLAGAKPLTLVSMDNCSANGEKLRRSVLEAANGWLSRGFVEEGFVDWVSNEDCVAFPLTMIDKITPRPDPALAQELSSLGIESMGPIITGKHTYIAPFVNTEAPQYLVVEDRFPNGRPPLEKAGVYMTDAQTVNKAERMKVMTCLNPLHTALAIFGCLLGYKKIADEMDEPLLWKLVRKIGITEGLPVVVDPEIIRPEDFLQEVLTERLPNHFLPDTPQRIATDTSQKVPIRYGETLRAYMQREDLDVASLTFIPLTIAGWCRYLLGVDDAGKPMSCSVDPRLEEVQGKLRGICFDAPDSVGNIPEVILRDESLWGCDLVAVGLGEKILSMLRSMCNGIGAVKVTLGEYLKD